jgi:hypothetical protein
LRAKIGKSKQQTSSHLLIAARINTKLASTAASINAVVEFGNRYAVLPIFRSHAQPPARRQGRAAPSCESFESDPAASGVVVTVVAKSREVK